MRFLSVGLHKGRKSNDCRLKEVCAHFSPIYKERIRHSFELHVPFFGTKAGFVLAIFVISYLFADLIGRYGMDLTKMVSIFLALIFKVLGFAF